MLWNANHRATVCSVKTKEVRWGMLRGMFEGISYFRGHIWSNICHCEIKTIVLIFFQISASRSSLISLSKAPGNSGAKRNHLGILDRCHHHGCLKCLCLFMTPQHWFLVYYRLCEDPQAPSVSRPPSAGYPPLSGPPICQSYRRAGGGSLWRSSSLAHGWSSPLGSAGPTTWTWPWPVCRHTF